MTDLVSVEKEKAIIKKEITYETLTSLIDQNISSVQFGIYSVAFCGFVIAVRSIRPFKKFKRPGDVPSSFFKKHVQLNGNVMRIDFSPKPVLLVDHHPLLLSRYRKPGQGLKVSVEGIDLSPNGISWLQTLVVGHDIKFILMSSQPEYVSSIIEYNKKDVGKQLVSLGFASVSTYNQELDSDKRYTNYYKTLLKQESRAESRKTGMWHDGTFNLLKFLFTKISHIFDRLKPKSLKLN